MSFDELFAKTKVITIKGNTHMSNFEKLLKFDYFIQSNKFTFWTHIVQ